MLVGTGLFDGVEADEEETTALDSFDEESEDTAGVVELGADDDDDWTPLIKIAPSMSNFEEVPSLITDFR